MTLDVQGHPILSQGEFVRLMKAFPEGYVGSGVLQAWWAGAEVNPHTLHSALNVGARLAIIDESVEPLIDIACERIEGAFPEESFGRGEE